MKCKILSALGENEVQQSSNSQPSIKIALPCLKLCETKATRIQFGTKKQAESKLRGTLHRKVKAR